MKFLADEGVDRTIVEGLRLLGFDVYYVLEEVRSLDDQILLKLANEENRILISRDKDFGELVYRLQQSHAGVILIRLEGETSQNRATIVCKLIDQYQQYLPKSFAVIQKGVIRIR